MNETKAKENGLVRDLVSGRRAVEGLCLSEPTYLCPVCNLALSYHPVFLDEHCTECGLLLWCYRREREGVVILEAIPGRTPAVEDIDRLAESLSQGGPLDRVVLNLSALDIVNTSLVARLLSLNKRIRAAGGTLWLCEPCPLVREIFRRFRLDSILPILDSEEMA